MLSCFQLCDPTNCSPPASSVHGILQARVREWVAIPFSRGSSQLRDGTWVSCIAGRFFTTWATREALVNTDYSFSAPQLEKVMGTGPCQPCFGKKPTYASTYLSQIKDDLIYHPNQRCNLRFNETGFKKIKPCNRIVYSH